MLMLITYKLMLLTWDLTMTTRFFFTTLFSALSTAGIVIFGSNAIEATVKPTISNEAQPLPGKMTPHTLEESESGTTRILDHVEATDARRVGCGVTGGPDLRDEVARAFRVAEARWSRFDAGRRSDPLVTERFVPEFLKMVFGFETRADTPPVHLADRTFPIGHAALGGRVPIVVAPAPADAVRRTGLDVPLPLFADAGRRRSATPLLQEYRDAAADCP